MNQRPSGEQLHYWLALTAKKARGHVNAETIAEIAGVSPQTIYGFEGTKTWPRDVEQLLAAYAQVGGYEDPRDLIEAALSWWREDGTVPTLEGSDGAAPRQAPRDRDEPLRAIDRLRREDSDEPTILHPGRQQSESGS